MTEEGAILFSVDLLRRGREGEQLLLQLFLLLSDCSSVRPSARSSCVLCNSRRSSLLRAPSLSPSLSLVCRSFWNGFLSLSPSRPSVGPFARVCACERRSGQLLRLRGRCTRRRRPFTYDVRRGETIVLIGCVSKTVTGGYTNLKIFADFICERFPVRVPGCPPGSALFCVTDAAGFHSTRRPMHCRSAPKRLKFKGDDSALKL